MTLHEHASVARRAQEEYARLYVGWRLYQSVAPRVEGMRQGLLDLARSALALAAGPRGQSAVQIS